MTDIKILYLCWLYETSCVRDDYRNWCDALEYGK